MKALLGLVFALAVITGCAAKPHDGNFTGLVDIGAGRWLHLNCQGSGSPTVFIIPGKGSYARVWNAVPEFMIVWVLMWGGWQLALLAVIALSVREANSR